MLVEIKILDLRSWWEVTPRDFGTMRAWSTQLPRIGLSSLSILEYENVIGQFINLNILLSFNEFTVILLPYSCLALFGGAPGAPAVRTSGPGSPPIRT